MSHTCPFLHDSADFATEEHVDMIENELNNHRLNSHFHESCCPTEAGRLDLL